MKYTVFIGLIAATAIAVASGSAYAKNGRHGAPVDFEKLDTNADGQITLEEMQARQANRFATADTNSDGFLTLNELEAAEAERAKSRAGKMLERHDANADGKLSTEELERPGHEKHAKKRFERADTNGDGGVTKEEFEAAMAKMKDRHDRKGSK